MMLNFCFVTNFNPHSRKGSDAALEEHLDELTTISIHTPARGVTNRSSGRVSGLAISIHTPARGVTVTLMLGASVWAFQSTLPQGE